MTSVREYYAKHLGPIYIWMAGGIDQAIKRGEAEIKTIHALSPGRSVAVDLGAGFGMHAIPLAHQGFSVIAIDTCSGLLEELSLHQGILPIQTVKDDILSFRSHLTTEVQLVLCMGDTLTHLPDSESVLQLISDIAETVMVGGEFITTFRDYSNALTGEQRFIPVRSDADRILTCFLEYGDSHVTVHDIVHEFDGSEWRLSVSSYQKLRLGPDWICAALKSNGFDVRRESGMAGMVRLVSTRVK